MTDETRRAALMRDQVSAIMADAADKGLLDSSKDRVDADVDARLLAIAREATGIQTKSELLEFALAYLALDYNFMRAFEDMRGTVDPSVQLGY